MFFFGVLKVVHEFYFLKISECVFLGILIVFFLHYLNFLTLILDTGINQIEFNLYL